LIEGIQAIGNDGIYRKENDWNSVGEYAIQGWFKQEVK